ncbi:FAD-dependent oxidoreductase [Amycolatopsis acidiphila]|uniref:FAD-dependent oxidoreductase n=1 Tax=Amycolatopsis acidiphila TaxID=715473 RepID=A0A558ALI6_9PSEU|nr:FAD-dependent oxidoreductase [Amycolatopsis acidiphila]TVT25071.1 FAD-dependent oxidoreductase [Amycolatopsis acidiphila]UIJ57417.1 FAD-dependent oxidoreductase [Amycolatopsis acidiphila]GHG84347.1 pyridine nucleotide-disulfide oxidoreductase [Amycolatopsis acidiphila]
MNTSAADRVVIVGASLAGLRTAEALRQNGFAGRLTLIGAEPHEPYDRPPLSKTVLSGWLGTDQVLLPRTCDLHAEWLLGVPATGLDPAAREVRLADGRAVAFDRLVLATGARARRWSDPAEAALRGVHLLRGRDDADLLRADLAEAVEANGRVLVIGGGFTGSEVASSCRDLGLPVTVTQRGAAPLAGALGEVVGSAIGERQQAHGIDLRVRTTVRRLEGDASGRLRRARLSDGSALDVRVAVVAVGSVRDTGWLRGSGLTADERGVSCDAACRALDAEDRVVDGVYVAGDVARWRHPRFDTGPVSFEHWGNAVDQAETVAHNMMSEDVRENDALPAFWSDQFGLNIKAVGMPAVADQVVLAQGSFEHGPFVAVYGRTGVTVGAVAVNSPRVLDGYAALVTERAPFPPVIDALRSPGRMVPVDSRIPHPVQELVTVLEGQS